MEKLIVVAEQKKYRVKNEGLISLLAGFTPRQVVVIGAAAFTVKQIVVRLNKKLIG